jgi:colanic acid biosynthesis glycosyl transferase WcaI
MSRVLLHSLVFSPDAVSTSYIMTELALELKRLGHSVSVLTTTPHYNTDERAVLRQPMARRAWGLWYESQLDGIPIWHATLPQKGNRVWARAIDYIRFHAVSVLLSVRSIGTQDIVISTSPPLSIGAVSWMLGVRWRVPSVYKVAEVYPDLAIRQGAVRSKLLINLMRALERFVYARSAMVVPIADQFRRIVKERGVPDSKLRLIPDCVDLDMYRPLPRNSPFAVQHGLVDEFVVLYGGNIGLVQDWESLLFAADNVRHLPIRFVVVGDGARREWLAAEVDKRCLTNVTLLGYQPKERMPEINAACEIAVVPLTFAGSKDGFPSKVYTSLACGRPVLVSATEGSEMATLVGRAQCGRVVPPESQQAFANAIVTAYRERDMLAEEGRRGRDLVERSYSKESIARQYDQLIRELTGQ